MGLLILVLIPITFKFSRLCPVNICSGNHLKTEDSQSVSRPVCLGVRRPSGARDQFFILFEIFFRQLRVCYFVVPPLTRGRVCNLLYNCFWALPEQSLLGRRPVELTAILYCLIWDSPNLEGQVSVFMSPKNRVAQLYPPGTGFLFCRLLRLGGLPWSSGLSQSQSHITPDRQSVGPSWCQAPIWDPRPIFLSPWDFLLDSCCLLCCSSLSD
jgi:hypothetical protein